MHFHNITRDKVFVISDITAVFSSNIGPTLMRPCMDTFAIFPRALTLNIISEYSEYYGVHMFSIFGAGLEGGGGLILMHQCIYYIITILENFL